jgi:hypothetical protein
MADVVLIADDARKSYPEALCQLEIAATELALWRVSTDLEARSLDSPQMTSKNCNVESWALNVSIELTYPGRVSYQLCRGQNPSDR